MKRMSKTLQGKDLLDDIFTESPIKIAQKSIYSKDGRVDALADASLMLHLNYLSASMLYYPHMH